MGRFILLDWAFYIVYGPSSTAVLNTKMNMHAWKCIHIHFMQIITFLLISMVVYIYIYIYCNSGNSLYQTPMGQKSAWLVRLQISGVVMYTSKVRVWDSKIIGVFISRCYFYVPETICTIISMDWRRVVNKKLSPRLKYSSKLPCLINSVTMRMGSSRVQTA